VRLQDCCILHPAYLKQCSGTKSSIHRPLNLDMSTSQKESVEKVRYAVDALAQTWQFARETTIRRYTISRGGSFDLQKEAFDQTILQDQRLSSHNTGSPPDLTDFPVELFQAYGWGNKNSPLSLTPGDFTAIAKWSQIPLTLLQRIPRFSRDVPHFWECELEEVVDEEQFPSDSNTTISSTTALNFAFKIDLRRNAYVTALLHYNCHTQKIKGLVFECDPPEMYPAVYYGRELLRIVEPILRYNSLRLKDNPLLLITLMFARLQHRLGLDFECDNMTKRTGHLGERAFTLNATEDGEINARLYDSLTDLGRMSSRIEVLLFFGNELKTQLQDLQAVVPAQVKLYHVLSREVANTARRLEIDKTELSFAKARLQGKFAILHNLINQRDSRISANIAMACRSDSRAMRTIAFLTLIFLPTTFVSAIFSTTIFDFQGWHSGSTADLVTNSTSGDVVSKGWWIYTVCCVTLTLVTVGAWYVWNRRAERYQCASELQGLATVRTKEEFEQPRKSSLGKRSLTDSET
jgi:hypothetical protein